MYLLKDAVKTYKDALRDDIKVTAYDLDPTLNIVGQAYVRDPVQRPVSWTPFLQDGLADKLPPLSSTTHAAVVFLEVDNRIAAIVFGMGRYMLKDTSYDADFGIIAALNSIDPNGLRSTDTFLLESVGVHKRTQTNRSTNMSDFEIDTTREQVRSLTGKAKNKLLAERITGNEGAFGVNVRITFKQLVDLCRTVVKASKAKDYKQNFPRFDNLRCVGDKQKIVQLENTLVTKLQTSRTQGIYLSPPEVLDYDDFSGFSFREKGPLFDELTVQQYIESRSQLESLDISALKRHRVYFRKQTADEPLARWSVFKCLICEFLEGKNSFMLMGGEWYKVANTFAQQVRNEINKIPEVNLGLPNMGAFKTETDYLKLVEKAGGGLIVLDQKRTYCEGSSHFLVGDFQIFGSMQERIFSLRYSSSRRP